MIEKPINDIQEIAKDEKSKMLKYKIIDICNDIICSCEAFKDMNNDLNNFIVLSCPEDKKSYVQAMIRVHDNIFVMVEHFVALKNYIKSKDDLIIEKKYITSVLFEHIYNAINLIRKESQNLPHEQIITILAFCKNIELSLSLIEKFID